MEMHGVENAAGSLLLVACVSVQQYSKNILWDYCSLIKWRRKRVLFNSSTIRQYSDRRRPYIQ